MSDTATPLEVLDALWKALRDYYPAFEYVGASDRWRDEFRARLQGVNDLAIAFPILEELVNRFQDYHTVLRWPGRPRLQSPPVRLGWVEDRVAVLKSSVEAVKQGDEIEEIDGRPARDLFREKLAVARGATAYARRQWASDRLLEGAPGTEVRIKLRRMHGQMDGVLLHRSGWPQSAEPPVSSRALAADAGYIRIPAWGAPEGVDLAALFDRALEAFQRAPHLVLDVRGNGGGLDALGDAVTGRFLRGPVVSSISFHRTPTTNHYEKTVEWAQPRGPWCYEGRVAVLTDEDCASACEHFVSGMKMSGRALLVGRPTTGACGWSGAIPLPGGATLYCSKTFPLHGTLPSALHGIPPHLLVRRTLAALRSDRDEVLEAALAYLRSDRPIPPPSDD